MVGHRIAKFRSQQMYAAVMLIFAIELLGPPKWKRCQLAPAAARHDAAASKILLYFIGGYQHQEIYAAFSDHQSLMPAMGLFRINPSCHRPSLKILGLASILKHFSHSISCLHSNTIHL